MCERVHVCVCTAIKTKPILSIGNVVLLQCVYLPSIMIAYWIIYCCILDNLLDGMKTL